MLKVYSHYLNGKNYNKKHYHQTSGLKVRLSLQGQNRFK